jgi:hypothetical protein
MQAFGNKFFLTTERGLNLANVPAAAKIREKQKAEQTGLAALSPG